MQWIVLTASDLYDVAAGPQADAIRTAATGTGQLDRFATVMPAIAARIRAWVQANPSNRISATDNAIPPELKLDALRLILEDMQSSLPGMALTDDQVRLCNNSREYLKSIGERKIAISLADDPLPDRTVQSNGNAQLVSSDHRILTPHHLRDL